MIYKTVEEKIFTNDVAGKLYPMKEIKVALKIDLLGRQHVFLQKDNGEDKVIYSEGDEKKKAAQAYDEVLTRLSEWKFKEKPSNN